MRCSLMRRTALDLTTVSAPADNGEAVASVNGLGVRADRSWLTVEHVIRTEDAARIDGRFDSEGGFFDVGHGFLSG